MPYEYLSSSNHIPTNTFFLSFQGHTATGNIAQGQPQRLLENIIKAGVSAEQHFIGCPLLGKNSSGYSRKGRSNGEYVSGSETVFRVRRMAGVASSDV